MFARIRSVSDISRKKEIDSKPTTVRSECTKVSSGIATNTSANGKMKRVFADLLCEYTLLPIDGARPIVKCCLRDNVFFTEAAGIDTCNRERVRRVQLGQRKANYLFGLFEFLGVSTRGIEQHIHAGIRFHRRPIATATRGQQYT